MLFALALAALACGAPNHINPGDTLAQPGGPYWACATATPSPTEYWVEWMTAQPGITVTVEHRTTPVPTETPYYRWGEFFLAQGAVVGDLEVKLLESSLAGGYNLAKFAVVNQGRAETSFTLSQYAFAVDAAGNRQSFDLAATEALGYPNPGELEMEPIVPGQARVTILAFAGPQPAQFGLTVNNLSAAPPPVWFNTGVDPVNCPYGQASWPIPMRGGQVAQRPGASVLGKTPLGDAAYRLTSPFGCSDWGSGSAGWCDPALDYDHDSVPDIWLHHGLDLAAGIGTPIYSPLQGTVTFSGWSEAGYGNLLVVRAPVGAGDYVWMYFAHQDQLPFKSAGDFVRCGENIGVLGTTGNSTGPHLHWETRVGPLSAGPYGATNVDPDGARARWEFVCAYDQAVPYLDECIAEGGC